MKRLILLASVLFLAADAFGGRGSRNTLEPFYGINVYQAATGSGYGSSMNINFNVQKLNRVFELGLMLDPLNKSVKGVEFSYKSFFGFHSSRYYHSNFRPFFQYDFLYRMPTEVVVAPALLQSGNYDPSLTGKKVTLEHAFGLGAQVSLFKQLYVEGSAGIGAYLGSHYLGEKPSSWGIHKDNFGIVPSFKLGLGVQF